jgi:TolA-binding protein
MYKTILLIIPVVLTICACEFKSKAEEYKSRAVVYYHKAKVALHLEEKGSLLVDKIDEAAAVSSNEEMSGALKEFAEEDGLAEEAGDEEPAKVSHAKAKDSESVDTIEGLKREIAMLKFENDRLRTELEEKAGITFHSVTEKTVSRGPASLAVPAVMTTPDATAAEVYKIGETFLKKGKYKGAKEYFSKLISRFPDDRLVSMSYFWLGEIASIQKDNLGAIEAYREAAYTSDTRERKAGSFYKIALTYKAMGKADFARQYFERVIAVMPDSKYGERALKELTTK